MTKTPDNESPNLTNTAEEEDTLGDESIDSVPMYRKKHVIIPVFVLLLAAAGSYWYWYTNFRGFNSSDDAYIDADRVAISSKMLGRITTLTLAEGDSVQAGAVIVKLDDSDLRAQEEQAKAAVASASQSVGLAKVNLDKAGDDLRRAEAQIKDHVITQEQYDHARQAREAAQAQYSISVAQVGTAKSQLGVIQTSLLNTAITSPMSGVISRRWVLPGDVIQPAQPIYTIYTLKNIWVTANIEETKLSSLHLNDAVDISVDSYPDHPFHGKLIQLGSNTASEFSLIPPNNASGNFTKVTQRVPIKISIDDAQASGLPLLPGMSVEVKVRMR